MGFGTAARGAAIAAVMAIAATADAAAVSYTSPVRLSDPGGSILHEPALAVGRDDTATIVWSRYLPSPTDATRLESVVVQRDGSIGPVRTLTESSAPIWSPQVAVDAAGRATVTWYAGAGSHRVQTLQLAADGSPGPVLTLSQVGAREPQVVVDSQGRSIVVWHRSGDQGLQVEVSRVDPGGWPGPPAILSPPGAGGFLPRLAIDAWDRVTVVWSGNEFVQGVRIAADGSPSPVFNASARTFGQGLPSVAVDSVGASTIVWQEDVPAEEREHPDHWRRIKAARLDADGALGPPRTLSEAGQAFDPRVAIDPLDRAVVAWTDQLLPMTVRAATMLPDGTAESQRVVSPPAQGGFTGLETATGPCGTVVAWGEHAGLAERPGSAKALAIGLKGELTGPSVVSDDPYAHHSAPKVAIDSAHRPLLAWVQSDGIDSSVQFTRGAPTSCPDAPPPVEPPPADRVAFAIAARGSISWDRLRLSSSCRNGPCRGRLHVTARWRPTGRRTTRITVARIGYRVGSGKHKLRGGLTASGRRLLARIPRSRSTLRVRVRDEPADGRAKDATRVALRILRRHHPVTAPAGSPGGKRKRKSGS